MDKFVQTNRGKGKIRLMHILNGITGIKKGLSQNSRQSRVLVRQRSLLTQTEALYGSIVMTNAAAIDNCTICSVNPDVVTAGRCYTSRGI